MYKRVAAWWVEFLKLNLAHQSPRVVGIVMAMYSMMLYRRMRLHLYYRKANCGFSTDVENAVIGYLY